MLVWAHLYLCILQISWQKKAVSSHCILLFQGPMAQKGALKVAIFELIFLLKMEGLKMLSEISRRYTLLKGTLTAKWRQLKHDIKYDHGNDKI